MSRMYREARITWNPFVGCLFDCKYCYPSFRRQAKRQKRRCLRCYNFEPHFHPERLRRYLPRTRDGEFIFCCDMGDISFAKPEWIEAIIRRIRELPDRDFLIQSKNPNVFREYDWPDNVILGTTIETDISYVAWQVSKAPSPFLRYFLLSEVRHPRKLVTVEPVMRFHLDILSDWIIRLEPWRVYVGYDSHPKKNRLLEPKLETVDRLVERLRSAGLDVRWKLRRKAWWES